MKLLEFGLFGAESGLKLPARMETEGLQEGSDHAPLVYGRRQWHRALQMPLVSAISFREGPGNDLYGALPAACPRAQRGEQWCAPRAAGGGTSGRAAAPRQGRQATGGVRVPAGSTGLLGPSWAAGLFNKAGHRVSTQP